MTASSRPDTHGDPLRDRIEKLLRSYRCQFTLDDDDGGGLHLVDLFTPIDHIDITAGKQEVHLLADMLAAELSPSLAVPSIEPKSAVAEEVLREEAIAGARGLCHPNLEWSKAVQLARDCLRLSAQPSHALPPDAMQRAEADYLRRTMGELSMALGNPTLLVSPPDSMEAQLVRLAIERLSATRRTEEQVILDAIGRLRTVRATAMEQDDHSTGYKDGAQACLNELHAMLTALDAAVDGSAEKP